MSWNADNDATPNVVRIHVKTTNAHHWAYSLDGAPDVHMPAGATYVDLNMSQVKPIESGDIVGFARFTGQATRTPNVYPKTCEMGAMHGGAGAMVISAYKRCQNEARVQNAEAATAVAKTNTADLSIHMFRLFDGCSKIQSSDGVEHDAVPHANNTDFGIASPMIASETNFLNPGFEITDVVTSEANDGMYVFQPEWDNQAIVASTGVLRDETGEARDDYRYYLRDFGFVRNLSSGFTVNLNGVQHNITVRAPRDNIEQYNSSWYVSDTQLKFNDGTNRFDKRVLYTETDASRAGNERVHSHQFVDFFELVAE